MKRALLAMAVAAQLQKGAAKGDVSGYYTWNWGSGSTGDHNATHSVAFTGLVDVATAISGYTQNASWCCPSLRGEKLLSLGGGNAAGEFTVGAITAAASPTAIAQIKAAGYDGVMFDVEEVVGPSAATVPAFGKAFRTLKNAGLTVGVTVSHSAPYQTDDPTDAVALAKAFGSDPNIDYLSPQLYSSGSEAAPQFDETASCVDQGCTWDLYKDSPAAFVPSIVEESHYAPTIEYFRNNHSIEVTGYFNWKQETSTARSVKQLQNVFSGAAGALVSGVVEAVLSGDGQAATGSDASEQTRLAQWVQARLAAVYPSAN